MRVFVGEDERGRPKQVTRTLRGTKREAQRLAAELTVARPSASASPFLDTRGWRLHENRHHLRILFGDVESDFMAQPSSRVMTSKG